MFMSIVYSLRMVIFEVRLVRVSSMDGDGTIEYTQPQFYIIRMLCEPHDEFVIFCRFRASQKLVQEVVGVCICYGYTTTNST